MLCSEILFQHHTQLNEIHTRLADLTVSLQLSLGNVILFSPIFRINPHRFLISSLLEIFPCISCLKEFCLIFWHLELLPYLTFRTFWQSTSRYKSIPNFKHLNTHGIFLDKKSDIFFSRFNADVLRTITEFVYQNLYKNCKDHAVALDISKVFHRV